MKFYYKLERSKGYIPGDKVHVHNEPYETSHWNTIIGKELQEKWNTINHEYPLDKNKLEMLFNEIDKRILDFLADKKLEDPKVKPFYLNFNADGIDCFVHRWNIHYKYKNL